MDRRALQRIAWTSLFVVVLGFDLVATGWFGFDERVVAMCRNIVVPGLGFIETDWWLTVVFVVAAIVAVTALAPVGHRLDRRRGLGRGDRPRLRDRPARPHP